MDVFTELFKHQRELHVIICQPCTIAIPPAQIAAHLKTRHPKVPVSVRKEVAAIVHTLPNLAWDKRICVSQSLQKIALHIYSITAMALYAHLLRVDILARRCDGYAPIAAANTAG